MTTGTCVCIVNDYVDTKFMYSRTSLTYQNNFQTEFKLLFSLFLLSKKKIMDHVSIVVDFVNIVSLVNDYTDANSL